MTENLLGEFESLAKRLDTLITTKLAAPGAEPPRLVRANSAFELAAGLNKLRASAEFAEFLRRG